MKSFRIFFKGVLVPLVCSSREVFSLLFSASQWVLEMHGSWTYPSPTRSLHGSGGWWARDLRENHNLFFIKEVQNRKTWYIGMFMSLWIVREREIRRGITISEKSTLFPAKFLKSYACFPSSTPVSKTIYIYNKRF